MVLVTGATGLVGNHLIQLLLAKKQKVKALYRSKIPAVAYANEVQWVKGDILDIQSLDDALQNVTQVYHCAAVVSFEKKNMQSLYNTNIEGTANMVNACLTVPNIKMVFVSSVAALGRIRENEMINESMMWTPETSNSHYGKTKYLAEMEVWRGIGEGLNAVIVNPSLILGYANWHKGSAAIFKKAYDEFPWFTDGVSGFVDVQDVVEAMFQLMNSTISEQRFVISGGNHAFKSIFTKIAIAFHKKPPHRKVSAFLAAIVWRIEAVKCFFTGQNPVLTKETAKTAQAKVYFDNQKLLKWLPNFQYTDIDTTINRICKEFIAKPIVN
ncbi:MAG: NAD-dependent epimerase/dehydratase family protein [Chitinophagaceae bacterium]